jgi:hypothetical protein
MNEQQWLQELELADCKVATSCRLHAFSSCNANTNIRFHDHGDVIGPITNREGRLVRKLSLDQGHDVTFLLWGDATCNHHLARLGDCHK